MSVKAGSLLDVAALEQDQKRIYNLQLFNKVDVEYIAEGSEATVVVMVSERWYIFPFPVLGFKYHDIKNFYYGAGLVHQNFRGRNEKIMASGAFGFDPWFNVAYRNPRLTDGDDLFLHLQLGLTHVRNQNTSQGEYDQQILSGNTSLGKRFGLFTTVTGLVGYDEWKVDVAQPGATLSPDGKDHYLVLSGGFLYDKRDLREYPLDGDFISLQATKYGLGESEVNLFRYQVDARTYQPLSNNISLGVRGFGSFLGGGRSPSYMHTYFGYFDRIRGYYSTVLEGEDQLGGSIELRLGIFKPRFLTISLPGLPPEFSIWRYGLYAGFFADAGTTWYRTDSFADIPWYTGYGAGLHFLLPYSFVLRTEYAFNQHGRGEFILGFHASF
jgi:outer membrane protein assembly factor BamA